MYVSDQHGLINVPAQHARTGERKTLSSRRRDTRRDEERAVRRKFPRDEHGQRVVERGVIVLDARTQERVNRLRHAAEPMVHQLRNRRHRERVCAMDTRKESVRIVGHFLSFLAARDCLPGSLDGLGERHFRRYMSHLAVPELAYSRSHIANCFSQLRKFFEFGLRKLNCIGRFDDYFGAEFKRSREPSVDHSIAAQLDADGKPLVPEEIIERIAKITPHGPQAAAVLALQLTVSARSGEALCLRPAIELDNFREGAHVHIRATGSKGGRPRLVYFPSKSHPLANAAEAALQRAETFVERTDGTVFRGKSLKQAERAFRYAVEKAGVTKARLGITPHSFRHEGIARAWEALDHNVPHRAPLCEADQTVLGLALLEVDRRAEIEKVGHSKPSKLDAYLGSFAKQRDRAGVPQSQRVAAGFLVRDLKRGDVYGAAHRRLELLCYPLDVVKARVAQNLEEGRQTLLPLPEGVQVPQCLRQGAFFRDR